MNKEVVLSACLSYYAQWYNTKLVALVERYHSLSELYDSWKKQTSDISSVLRVVLSDAWSEDHLISMQETLKRHAIQGVVLQEKEYPCLLAQIPDPPYVLFYQGSRELFCLPHLISCVGTRSMSLYGKRVVHRLLGDIQGVKIGVVSGLALGIDGEVHRTSLSHTIPTLAVLGGGLDRHEPTTHSGLAKEILDNNGLIISEYPPGVRPYKSAFLERNRIIAGLSLLTIVIEGRARSGSLVTARAAAHFGREVGVVPGDIFSPLCEGTLQMLREGAIPIINGSDILAALGIERLNMPEMEQSHSALYHIIRTQIHTPLEVLQEKSGLSLSDVQEQLTLLEIEGKVAMNAQGEYYTLR